MPVLHVRTTACAVILLLGGCAAAYEQTHPPVPPVLAEDVPAPPRSRIALIWRPGHYDWTGTTYQWRPGAWVDRAGHGSLWQDGYWKRSGNDAVWVPAHWM